MKNIRTTIEIELDKLDLKWRNLPVKTQVRYVLCLFAFYMIMGVGVLVKVFYDLGKEDRMHIGHIEVPSVIQQDSIINEPKSSRHGREGE